MSEHENGNFVLKCGQNQQKYQSFMAISDFALLYRIRRCAARSQLLSFSIPPVVFLENMVSIRKRGEGMQSAGWFCFPGNTVRRSPGVWLRRGRQPRRLPTQARAVITFPKNNAEAAPVLRAASVRFF